MKRRILVVDVGGSNVKILNFARAFRKPVHLLNDAAMQALGSYHGGKMLFLGLGAGLGAALVVNGIVVPLELAHLPFRKGEYEDYVGLLGGGNAKLLRKLPKGCRLGSNTNALVGGMRAWQTR